MRNVPGNTHIVPTTLKPNNHAGFEGFWVKCSDPPSMFNSDHTKTRKNRVTTYIDNIYIFIMYVVDSIEDFCSRNAPDNEVTARTQGKPPQNPQPNVRSH
jgi:hypothetical protein